MSQIEPLRQSCARQDQTTSSAQAANNRQGSNGVAPLRHDLLIHLTVDWFPELVDAVACKGERQVPVSVSGATAVALSKRFHIVGLWTCCF